MAVIGGPPAWEDLPPAYRSILLGLREELEAISGVEVGLQFANATWGTRYRYGVSVFQGAGGRHPSHVCNIYIHDGDRLTVVWRERAGEVAYDLADPESIPQVVTAVMGLLQGKG